MWLRMWELGARRELAIWRKQLQPMKGLVRAYFLLEYAKREGVNLETLLKETSVDGDAVNVQKVQLSSLLTKVIKNTKRGKDTSSGVNRSCTPRFFSMLQNNRDKCRDTR